MTPLRVLLVADVEDDARRVERELVRGGFDVRSRRVDGRASLLAALRDEPWDLVVSDFALSGFDARGALSTVREAGLDVPVIVVSGAVGEAAAVELMRAGARDVVLEDALARLVPAVRRELHEAEIRRLRRSSESASDRMASVGMLAAGVAHEINNPLAALIASLELAARAVGEGGPRATADLRDLLRDAREASERVRLIVRDLKLLSREEEDVPVRVDPLRALESSFRLAWNEIRHRGSLVRDLRPVPPVLGHEARLGRVFLDLLVNAAQAIPEGTRDATIRVTTGTDGAGRAVVEVRDDGAGMTEEARRRLFEPFFTAKPAGVGTGLGLSICHRIVSLMGGSIEVESAVGAGTTVRVLLPPAPVDAPEAPAKGAAAVTSPARRGRVLVVDDDAHVGRVMPRGLRDHDVTVVQSGKAALERLAAESFDVVFCDLMMPEMSGPELYDEVLARWPAVAERFVFLTGGAFTPHARAFLERVDNARLEKPFELATVKAIVASRLGAKPD